MHTAVIAFCLALFLVAIFVFLYLIVDSIREYRKRPHFNPLPAAFDDLQHGVKTEAVNAENLVTGAVTKVETAVLTEVRTVQTKAGGIEEQVEQKAKDEADRIQAAL